MNKFAIKENGFEYVDLGLPSGTMWAICNVGASRPEGSGLLCEFARVNGYKYGDNTTHDVVDVNGVKGMMFTSNINKRKLFMPFMKGSVYNLNWDMWNQHFANIWLSQVYASNGDNAYALHCATFGYTVVDDYSRRFAYTVRGVFKK